MLFNQKTIRWKLFTYYFFLFAIFTFSIIAYQNSREKHYRTAELEAVLNEYSEIVNRHIESLKLNDNHSFNRLDSLKEIIPPSVVRITVIDFEGKVLYDNTVHNYQEMANHRDRPEFQKALFNKFGENIRQSTTTNDEYLYYAKAYKKVVIRAALIYNSQVKAFLKPDNVFIPFFIFLFVVFGALLMYIANHIGDSIAKLKDFVVKIRRNDALTPGDDIKFSNDELGFISQEIITLYKQLKLAKTEALLEKEKLIGHLNVLKEGIAFFSADKKVILNNSHFVFYSNIISDVSSITIDKVFEIEALEEINKFIHKHLTETNAQYAHELPRMELSLQREGYHFLIQCIFFPDKSFEILISDRTQLMRRSKLKQEITSNISHELKTPIASVKGYLETVLNNSDMEKQKQIYFIDKAYQQTERLTQLVNDISLLNKIEEYSDLYAREKVHVKQVINEVLECFNDQILAKSITILSPIDDKTIVTANYSLVFSIFRNLMENAVNYAGENITIAITKYHQDTNFCYFSFSDNGIGVEEEHLSRLFERFYRVDSGRSRKMGGTGLGLAIVKNAVISFKGEISARKRNGGGLEFLFSLPL